MHRRTGRIANVLLLCSAGVAAGHAKQDDLVVKIDSGLVRVTHSADYPNVAFFLGIPHAPPPVDALRWKPPQLPPHWHGVRKADELNAACPQTDRMFKFRQRVIVQIDGDPSKLRAPDKTSEDCLYLNVMTTGSHSTERRPVMVFIHGGSGISGRGDDEGAAFANAGVVVT
jgi:para-nitrobenzyl esterase